MGQQQLLLLVLGIVIVGLAVVVGIRAFSENQEQSNMDAMVNDGLRILTDAQAWALKPQTFGGGEGSYTGINFGVLGYVDTPITGDGYYTNVNGTYGISALSDDELYIIGCNPSRDDAMDIEVQGFDDSNILTLTNLIRDGSLTECPL